MSENEILSEPFGHTKEVDRLWRQASRLELVPGDDFERTVYTIRTTGEKIPVVRLTDTGKLKREQIKEQIFGEDKPHLNFPFGNDFDFAKLEPGSIVKVDGLLALSLIRRRTGGYVCSFTDDFTRLREETYQASIINTDPTKQTARIMFDHWPGEYIHHQFVVESVNLEKINEPISIGPECVVDFQILKDGRPHEDLVGWAKNVVKRNILGKR